MDLFGSMRAWCRGASAWPRVPLLLLVAYWALRHIGDAEYSSLIDGLNFGVHELGHVLFSPFGEFLAAAGGTLLQCAAPLLAAAMFLRQRDYFAIAFCCAWLATNLFDVARYAGDARARALPLVGLGAGEPQHDWFYLLRELGLLNADRSIAALLRVGGGALFALSLTLGAWLLWEMARSARAGASSTGYS